MTAQADIGVIGLAVMGQNLILNINDHGFKVVAFNRTTSKVDEFLQGAAKGTNIVGAYSIEELVAKLKAPRKILLMVRAGQVVDEFINALLPHLSKGDIIIDGGNSNYLDTNRRVKELQAKGINFIGSGVSGGEEGARHGPSIMPGGSIEAWQFVKPILQAISAKTSSGEPCCDWVGADGAGHYVKMVHNGIEYGDMQLIAEAYQFLKEGLNLNHSEMQEIFQNWQKTDLNSYLIEITAQILGFKDEDGEPLVTKILDTAGQKGTGKWTAINAFDLGVPLTLIAEAVFVRCISSLKAERVQMSKLFQAPKIELQGDKAELVESLYYALLASKIISYAQGFMLIREASQTYGWNINYGATAMLWREGCIIRSGFLGNIKEAYENDPNLIFLGADPYFHDILQKALPHWRKIVSLAITSGISMPCTTAGLTFLDGYRSEQSSANLLQAQRDFFGAHGYERIDKPAGQFFHTNWTGKGGNTASTNYDV